MCTHDPARTHSHSTLFKWACLVYLVSIPSISNSLQTPSFSSRCMSPSNRPYFRIGTRSASLHCESRPFAPRISAFWSIWSRGISRLPQAWSLLQQSNSTTDGCRSSTRTFDSWHCGGIASPMEATPTCSLNREFIRLRTLFGTVR